MPGREHFEGPPPFLPGADRPDRSSRRYHVCDESRSLIAMVVLHALVTAKPKASAYDRAKEAWEQADNLLKVRAESREQDRRNREELIHEDR